VGFTWLNDLSFDQMLEKVKTLPPHSFIFVVLMMRDASGVTHNGDEVLQQIHAVANAAMTRAMEQLTQAQHKAAETLYKQAGPAPGGPGPESAGPSGAPGGPGAPGGAGDVIDAEVVEDDKR